MSQSVKQNMANELFRFGLRMLKQFARNPEHAKRIIIGGVSG